MTLSRPAETTMSAQEATHPPVSGHGTAVEIEDLRVEYDGVVAVEALDLTVRPGEMLVLLGPSGCGKTSTLRSVAGLETPTGGRISVGHDVVFDAARGVVVPPHKRRIGMVFQSYAVWPHMTVAQNVGFPLKMQRRGRAEIRARVAEVLEVVGLAGMAKRGASRLSGGQMQRVALARSLAMQPSILLLDEPLSNLDAKLRERLRFELREVQQRIGITSIYVTHDQSEAFALADRVAVMSAGRIEQLDGPDRIYTEPVSRRVAEFLGVENIASGMVRSQRPGGLAEVEVADSDLTIVAPGSSAAVGRPVSVCFRSESVELVTGAGSADPDDGDVNVWEGTVRTVNFLGSQWRYRIDLDAGPVVEGTSTASLVPGAVGDRRRVRVTPPAIRLLDADEPGAAEPARVQDRATSGGRRAGVDH
jgi:iron(III) transport system ATP-binding protein